MKKWIDLAFKLGFSKAYPLNCTKFIVHPETREICTTNRCNMYGKCWTCPPACGSLEYCAKILSQYHFGLLVELVQPLDDPFDIEGMMAAGKLHQEKFIALVDKLREIWPRLLPLSANTCTRCETCTYPISPCRFPKTAFSPIEAFGLIVSEIYEANEIPYIYQEKNITLIGCCLLA